jgi:chromosome segregation ATPase
MIMRNLAGKFLRFMSWLCFEHEWARWELMIVAVVVLFLLLLILRLLRKETLTRTVMGEVPERSPIIGLRLADHKVSRREIRIMEKRRLASASQQRRHQKELKETRGQMDTLKEQVHQLQRELTEHSRMEAHLKRQIAELTAPEGQLEPPPVQSSRTDPSLEQKLAELTTANKQLHDDLARHQQAEVRLERQIEKLMAANTQLQKQASEQPPPENIPVQSVEQKPKPKRPSGPLDPEELSQLAELGKRLAPRRTS